MPTPASESELDGDLEVVSTLDGRFVSYAQNAEDVVLARALRPDERLGIWIDVGAGHPRDDSVTAAFSVRGWHGINIEPRPEMHRLLAQERPRDVNLCVALGDRSGTATLWVPERDPNLSTTSAAGRERILGSGDRLVEATVSVTTLASVCEEHVVGEIDFLKIDVEGSERDVLVGADWDRWRPRVITIEAVVPESSQRREAEFDDVLRTAEYEHVLFDGLNSFYIRQEEPSLGELLGAAANINDHFVTAQLQQKLLDLRRAVRYNEQITTELRTARAQLGDLEGRVAKAERDREDALRELHGLRQSRTFRSTAWIRRVIRSPQRG